MGQTADRECTYISFVFELLVAVPYDVHSSVWWMSTIYEWLSRSSLTVYTPGHLETKVQVPGAFSVPKYDSSMGFLFPFSTDYDGFSFVIGPLVQCSSVLFLWSEIEFSIP